MKLKRTGAETISTGLLDVPFETRYSGSYMVETVPLDEVKQIQLTNISPTVLKLSIPVLPKLTIDYKILPGKAVLLPLTPLTDYFVRQSEFREALKYKFL